MLALLLTILLLLIITGFELTEEANMYPGSNEKPNFLLILVEDIGPWLKCYGDSTVSTPNLERLAAEGVRYTHVYSTAGVCAPSRSALITGMYPASVGTNHMRTLSIHPNEYIPLDSYSVVLPPEVKCFTEYLRRDGYYCTNRGKRDWQFKKPLTAFDDYGLEGAHWRNREEGQAFFSIVNIFDTHESMIWMRENESYHCSPDTLIVPPYFPETEQVERDLHRMYSNIVSMDRKVGSILEELSADSLLEKTYVIFLSDHGGPLPRQKREIISSGLEVPMIIRFPGRERGGTVDDRLISFIDLAPTFLSLAGIPVPDHIHGEAFLGEQESAPRKYIHGARDRMDTEYDRCRSVSDGEFFYVKNYHPELPWVQDIDYRENMGIMKCLMSMHDHDSLDDVEELWFMETKPEEMLFHSETDPWEVKNLASDPAYRTKLLELREAHHQWLREYGDMGIMPESIMVKQMWPEYVQPRTANPVCFMDSNNISISCKTPGSSIAYHIDRDNSVPDPAEPNNWKLYTGPVYLNEDEYIHVKAIRIGYADSEVVSILPKNKKTISSYTQNSNND